MSVKIDLITQDHSNDEFALILVEDGPWPVGEDFKKCLSRIQARIFDTMDVAIDGHLAAKCPESKGKKVRIQIDSPHGAPSDLVNLVFKLREYIAENGSDHYVAIKNSPYIKKLSIVLGHERNPFN